MAKDKNTEAVVTSRVSYGNIIDPDRDTTDLMDKKLTPATIKVLLGQLDEDSDEYKILKEKYQAEITAVKKPGVIRLKDKNNRWQETKSKSQFINLNYRVEKEIPVLKRINTKGIKKPTVKKPANLLTNDLLIDTSTSLKTSVNKKSSVKKNLKSANPKPTNLIKPPLKETELLDNNLSDWSKLDINKIKTKLENNSPVEQQKKQIIRRNEMDETIKIRLDLRPVFAQQISQIKRSGLSVVDFVIDPADKIEIEKGDEEILVRLIKQNQAEIKMDEFAEKDPTPPKPTPVKVIRTVEDPLTIDERLIMRLENKARFYKLNETEQEQLNELKGKLELKSKRKQKEQQGKESIENKKHNEHKAHYDANEQSESLVYDDRYKKTNYNHRYDESKRPNIDQRLAYEQKMTKYLFEVRQQYEQGYNRQISQELADFNRAINLSRSIKSTDQKLYQQILANRETSTALLRRHVILLNQKQYAEIRLLDKQILKHKDSKGNIEEFIKRQKEFQRLLQIREEVKENRSALIDSLRTQAKLMQEARSRK